MAKLDEETSKEISDANAVLLIIDSIGWKLIEEKLREKIIDLQSIMNVDNTTPDNAIADIRARIVAVNILNDWLKQDIHGFVEQQRANSEALRDSADDGYITRPGT